VYVAARQFDFVFSDEPIMSVADLAQVPRIDQLEIPAGALVEFRVTSLDVNHGFGLYGPGRQIIAQTQAMPGYFNRLLVRLAEPAQYKVLCLEYCAAGHHLMQTRLTVK
jgi:cytochrome c oxidase subunit 2